MSITPYDVFAGARSVTAASLSHVTYLPAMLLAVATAVLTGLVLVFGHLPGDTAASRGFQSIDTAWLHQLMLIGDTAGSKVWLFGLLGTVLATLAPFRRWREVSVLGLAAAFYAFSPVLKQLIQRPRPDIGSVEVLVTPVGYSFPSGHAMGSGLIIGGVMLVAILMLRSRPYLQVLAGAAGLGMLAIIGASRIYLGAHWMSDVIAGYALAAMFLIVAVRLAKRYFDRTPETSNREPETDAGAQLNPR